VSESVHIQQTTETYPWLPVNADQQDVHAVEDLRSPDARPRADTWTGATPGLHSLNTPGSSHSELLEASGNVAYYVPFGEEQDALPIVLNAATSNLTTFLPSQPSMSSAEHRHGTTV
jgi:hypothetical protein